MFAERVVLPAGVRLQYIVMRALDGRTMLSADLAMASSPSKVIPFSAHTKTDEEIERAFDTHGNSILRLAYSYLHNMEDAEDILQETLIRYMDKAPAFENASHEKAWLLRVAANLSKNKIDYNNIRKACGRGKDGSQLCMGSRKRIICSATRGHTPILSGRIFH